MCCGILHSNRGHPLIPNSLSYAVPTARLPIHCAYAFPFSIRFHGFHKLGYYKAKAMFVTQFFIVETVVASGFIGAVAQFI